MFTEISWLDVLLRAVILVPIAFIVAVAWIRIVGLRALSKMSNFDFIVTLAFASTLASTCTAPSWAAFGTGLLVMITLLGVQWFVARRRKDDDRFREIIGNTPTLLVHRGLFLDDTLKRVRVTRGDILAKLRENNVAALDQVQAVVLEPTGDISVLHGHAGRVEERLFEDVQTGNTA